MNGYFSKFLLTGVLTFSSMIAFAQPGDPPPSVPIDGGISLLAAAGIGYGTKKILDLRKKQKNKEE